MKTERGLTRDGEEARERGDARGRGARACEVKHEAKREARRHVERGNVPEREPERNERVARVRLSRRLNKASGER